MSGNQQTTATTDTQDEDFYELVYARDVAPMIRAHWPHAEITDASDAVHPGRFEVRIPGVSADAVYPVAIAEGWSYDCLCVAMIARDPGRSADVRRWVAKAREIRDSGSTGDDR